MSEVFASNRFEFLTRGNGIFLVNVAWRVAKFNFGLTGPINSSLAQYAIPRALTGDTEHH